MSPEPALRRAGGIGSGALGRRPDSLADVLERVLDKGIVIAGDVVVNILDIELLTLKLRLFVSSAETAREMGLDWWTHDPFFSGRSGGQVGPADRGRPAPGGADDDAETAETGAAETGTAGTGTAGAGTAESETSEVRELRERVAALERLLDRGDGDGAAAGNRRSAP